MGHDDPGPQRGSCGGRARGRPDAAAPRTGGGFRNTGPYQHCCARASVHLLRQAAVVYHRDASRMEPDELQSRWPNSQVTGQPRGTFARGKRIGANGCGSATSMGAYPREAGYWATAVPVCGAARGPNLRAPRHVIGFARRRFRRSSRASPGGTRTGPLRGTTSAFTCPHAGGEGFGTRPRGLIDVWF